MPNEMNKITELQILTIFALANSLEDDDIIPSSISIDEHSVRARAASLISALQLHGLIDA